MKIPTGGQQHLRVFVCKHVLDRERPILLVSRADGPWCFLCGGTHEQSTNDFKAVGLEHVLEQDASCLELLDLEEGWEAERRAPLAPWIRSIPGKTYLSAIYRAYRTQRETRIAFIEEWLAGHDVTTEPTIDEQRNEHTVYTALFSDECRAEIEDCFREAMRRMRGKSFSESEDDLNALAFLQHVVAAAMWKHRCDTGDMLETFAREFDRLDVELERMRLHMRAQKM